MDSEYAGGKVLIVSYFVGLAIAHFVGVMVEKKTIMFFVFANKEVHYG